MSSTDADRLSSAAARGDLAGVQMLLHHGADVTVRNVFGRTPLQVMKLGNPAVAEVLLHAHADPNLRDPVRGLTVLHDAARDGYGDTLGVLVAHGGDVNLRDTDGHLPLHLAAREGHLEAVQVLIERTADPLMRNTLGQTPYDLAQMNHRVSTAQYIQGYLHTHNHSALG